MTELDVSNDVSNFRTNDNFINWMMTINALSKESILRLSPLDYIHGLCEDFGVYFAVRYNVELLFLNNEHNVVKIMNKFYDGFNSYGVINLSDLQYVKESEHLSKLSEAGLRTMLKVDNDWKTYKPLSSNVHLIERKY